METRGKVDGCITPKIVLEMDDDSNLVQLLEAFEMFLKGCGFHIDGEVDIVGQEEDHE